MKKNLLYLLALICTLNFFTACSDDDDDDKPGKETWEQLTKEYSGDALTVNGGAKGKVDVKATSATAALITLESVVPEAKNIKIDATLATTKSYATAATATPIYTLAGDATVNDTKIAVTGTFDNKGSLTLNVTRTLPESIAKSWKLSYIPTATAIIPVVYTDVATGDAATDAQLNAMIPAVIGGLMAGKVKAVTADLKSNGSFEVEWTNVTGETNKLSELEIYGGIKLGAFVELQYAVIDSKFYLTINKKLFVDPVLAPMLEAFLLSKGIELETLLKLMTDLGGYYGFPLNFKQDGDNTTFYLNKEQLDQILVIAKPFMGSIENENLAQMLAQVELLLKAPTTTKFDFGLTFNK